MRCEFLVKDGTRFEDEREQPLAVGDLFTQLDVTYRVDEELPGHEGFTAVYKVTHVGGPTETSPSPAEDRFRQNLFGT